MHLSKRTSWLVLAVVALVLVAGAALTWDNQSPTRPRLRGSLGPVNSDTDAYVGAKRSFLIEQKAAHPDATSAALVSFSRLVGGEEAKALLPGLRTDAAFVNEPESGQRVVSPAQGFPDCVCIYAVALTEAPIRLLADLAGRPEVRLVDLPDPIAPDLRGWELRPLVV